MMISASDAVVLCRDSVLCKCFLRHRNRKLVSQGMRTTADCDVQTSNIRVPAICFLEPVTPMHEVEGCMQYLRGKAIVQNRVWRSVLEMGRSLKGYMYGMERGIDQPVLQQVGVPYIDCHLVGVVLIFS